MAYRVVISPRARIQLSNISAWWGEHRSSEQAVKWLAGWKNVWLKLSLDPQAFPLAQESESLGNEVRECRYGLRKKKTHRAVFTVRGEQIIVHAVRHLSQDTLKEEDFS